MERGRTVYGDEWAHGAVEGRVIALLQSAGLRGLNLRELHSQVGGHVLSEDLRAALERLRSEDLAEMHIERSTGGRPAQRWTVSVQWLLGLQPLSKTTLANIDLAEDLLSMLDDPS